MHALIQDNKIVQVGALPHLWHDGERWWDFRPTNIDPAPQGWLKVTDTPRPPDTPTHTHDYAVELIDGTPTVTWTVRDKTPDELAAEAAQQVESTLTEQVASEVQAIRDAIGPGDAPAGTGSLNAIINTPNPDINANPAQVIKPALRIVRAIVRAVIRIARIAVRDYSTPADD